MKKIIDKTLTFTFLFILFYFVCVLFVQNFQLKIALSILASILFTTIISLYQKLSSNKLNYKNFEILASVKGNDYILDKLLIALNNLHFTRKDNFLINEQNEIIFCSIKFGSISPDEILKLDKTAKQENATKCYLIGKELQKVSAITLYNYTDNFKFIPLKIVFKLLKSQKLLDKN